MNKSEILTRQKDFEESFNSWFSSGLQQTLADNRARYRMQMQDAEEREERGLSALPSTKSTSVVDRAVDRALMDYHTDADSISFTSRAVNDPVSDQLANILTKDFQYRAQNTFPFFTWHNASLTACFADGMEAAMVRWKKESYQDDGPTEYEFEGEVFSEDEIAELSEEDRALLTPRKTQSESVLCDTWWIDQLKPGENFLWDFKAPYLDVNMGQAALVKIPMTVDEIMDMAEKGLFRKMKRDEVERKLSVSGTESVYADINKTVSDPQLIDGGFLNRAPVWIYFFKEKFLWFVTFSIDGEMELSDPKPVNDVFFNGRPVNRLPVVLGTAKLKLLENVGRGLPETIAPIEDEWTAHRNNINDAAKITIQGRWRVEPGAEVCIDDVLNNRTFYASQGDVEAIDRQMNLMDSMRAADSLNADMNELVPVGMESRQLVPKGTNKTLGATQLALGGQQEKLSVQLMVRNETFFKPLLWLIAQLTFAFESDETIFKIAAIQAGVDPNQPPFAAFIDGKPGIDFSVFDFDANVQINAGLGSVPRQQKLSNMMMIYQLAQSLGVDLDGMDIVKRANVLAGFDANQFNPQARQPSPPPVDYKLDIKTSMMELAALDPEISAAIIQKIKEGQFSVSTVADDQAAMNEMMHNMMSNPSGAPVTDVAGNPEAAQGMSEGGQIGGMGGY